MRLDDPGLMSWISFSPAARNIIRLTVSVSTSTRGKRRSAVFGGIRRYECRTRVNVRQVLLRLQAEFLYPPLLKTLILVIYLLCEDRYKRLHYGLIRTNVRSSLLSIGFYPLLRILPTLIKAAQQDL